MVTANHPITPVSFINWHKNGSTTCNNWNMRCWRWEIAAINSFALSVIGCMAGWHIATVDDGARRGFVPGLQAARDAGLIKPEVRDDPRANALFLDLLTSRNDPETALRWMNEAGVFGRFVPDFGRVNAQMQFDMYHHYTVDEHTIRAIGLLSQIERGMLEADHPRATREFPKLASRRALYVAVLLHDIAKGRGGDHSVLGADVAHQLCPRFGLDEKETDLVAWLVLQHLLMSRTAQKRDLTDPKTIEDFVGEVQGLERLRHLMILTAIDIRAVGPGTWNSWKGQLLGELYDAAEERLRLGHMSHGRKERVAAKKEAVRAKLGDKAQSDIYAKSFDDQDVARLMQDTGIIRRRGRPDQIAHPDRLPRVSLISCKAGGKTSGQSRSSAARSSRR